MVASAKAQEADLAVTQADNRVQRCRPMRQEPTAESWSTDALKLPRPLRFGAAMPILKRLSRFYLWMVERA